MKFGLSRKKKWTVLTCEKKNHSQLVSSLFGVHFLSKSCVLNVYNFSLGFGGPLGCWGRNLALHPCPPRMKGKRLHHSLASYIKRQKKILSKVQIKEMTYNREYVCLRCYKIFLNIVMGKSLDVLIMLSSFFANPAIRFLAFVNIRIYLAPPFKCGVCV